MRQRAAYLVYARENDVGGNDGNIIFGEVNPGFHQGNEFDKLLLDGCDPLRQCAFKLLGSDAGLEERLRVDEVANGFGLGEIDTAVQKGTHGELAGFGEASAVLKGEFDDVSEDHGRSVGRNLDEIVGGVRVRFLEKGDDNFIDALAVLGVDELAEDGTRGLEIATKLQK